MPGSTGRLGRGRASGVHPLIRTDARARSALRPIFPWTILAAPGPLTGSENGQAVAPLMGDFSDYDLGKLIWMWDVTSVADKRIIEHNQKGVGSRFYRPGPYTGIEFLSKRFADWYVRRVSSGGSA